MPSRQFDLVCCIAKNDDLYRASERLNPHLFCAGTASCRSESRFSAKPPGFPSAMADIQA
jgi:hypothetical protein